MSIHIDHLGRRARRIREEIFTAAMHLFAERGVADVSMQDIADQAETARSTVFKHYPQKLALLSDFFMRLGNDALAAAKAKNTVDFRGGMKALFLAIQQEARKVEPVLREVAGMAVGNGPLAVEEATIDDQMKAYISDLLKVGVETGEVHADIKIREAVQLILCVITDTNRMAIHLDRVQHIAKDQGKRFNMLFRGLGPTS